MLLLVIPPISQRRHVLRIHCGRLAFLRLLAIARLRGRDKPGLCRPIRGVQGAREP